MGSGLNTVFDVVSKGAPAFGPAGQVVSAISSVAGMLGNKKGGGGTARPAPVTRPNAAPTKPAQAPAFKPTRPDAMTRPDTLNELATFDPVQERSALATRGVQSGLGSQEDAYYRNLVQRSFIGEGNKVSGNLSTLLPVESQYLSGQGVNTSDLMDFLRQLRG